MAHTKPENLRDIAPLLEAIAALPGVVQKKPGIFYLKSIGFLHFHDKDGVRWADVKDENGWRDVPLDFGAGKVAQAKLLKAARAALASLTGKKK
jgi:hypothetical protein